MSDQTQEIIRLRQSVQELTTANNERVDTVIARADAVLVGVDDRVYPGVYSTPPTKRPSGSPSQEGDRCLIIVNGMAYEHLFVGGGWVVPNIAAEQLQTGTGATMVGLQMKSSTFLMSVYDKLQQWISVEDHMTPEQRADSLLDSPQIPSDDAWDQALAAAVSRGIFSIRAPKRFRLKRTVVIPVGVVVIGQGRGCYAIPDPVNTFIGGWMFLVNSTNGTTWTSPYPNIMAGGVMDMNFRNESQTAGIRGVKGFGGVILRNFRGYYMSQLAERAANLYSDQFHVADMISEPVMGTDYQVRLLGLGDCPVIEMIHMPWNAVNPGDGTPNALEINGTLAGVIKDCIGGNIKITNSNLTLEKLHIEKGQILVGPGNVDIKDSVISSSGKIPIIFDNAGATQSHACSLENVEFDYMERLLEWAGADVQVGSHYNLKISNCRRRWLNQADVTKSQMSSIILAGNDGNLLTGWAKHSYMLSRSGEVLVGNKLNPCYTVAAGPVIFDGIVSGGVDSLTYSGAWKIASGTYYYSARLFLDIDRRIGRGNGATELSVDTVLNAGCVRLDISYGSRTPLGILRVFRGIAAGAYNAYVDIPIFSLTKLYDNGERVNGYPWIVRAAGALDAPYGYGESSLEVVGDRVVMYADAYPTAATGGTWSVGDDIVRVTPTAGGKRAWTCTVAGTPGTWKAYGAIDA